MAKYVHFRKPTTEDLLFHRALRAQPLPVSFSTGQSKKISPHTIVVECEKVEDSVQRDVWMQLPWQRSLEPGSFAGERRFGPRQTKLSLLGKTPSAAKPSLCGITRVAHRNKNNAAALQVCEG
ncbi:hypothetical protein Bbelb_158030 [Branchiostoma belcheri]|nr:hypothetical protein Bbelb_158030 [Branchiostoma belcheri]